MRRFLKILFGFVVVAAVAIVAAIFLIPREKIVALATDQVRTATGRELTLAGDISPSFWPVLGVRTGTVTLSNADWGAADHLVSANAAEIGVELMPLFSGEVKVATLRLVDPVVSLEVNRDGLGNWVFDTEDGAPKASAEPSEAGELKISLPEAVISNGTIRFHDAQTGQQIELAALDLTAGLASMDAPLTLEGSALWNGQRANLNAMIGTPAAIIEGHRASVEVALASDPANFSFAGEVQIDPAAALPLIDGAISADIPNPGAAAGWASGGGASTGLAEVGAVKLDGNISATEAALQLVAKGSVGYKGRAVGFEVSANGGAGWLERQTFNVAIEGAVDNLLQASFDGPVSAGGTLAAEGPLRLSVRDIGALAEWAGGARLDTPEGTFEQAQLEAGLTMAGDRIELSGLAMTVDQTRLTGNAAVRTGGRPYVSANLESGPLDLTPFMGQGGGGSGGGSGGGQQGWSTEPLDLSALRKVDADVAIRAEAVDLGEIEIGRSDIAATLRDGRLDMHIDRVDAYGGGMTGTVVVLAGDATEVATDLTISQVQLRPLLNALAGFDSLEGLGAFRIKANGRGQSMDALMRSLDGQGGLDLTDGAILGVNLAAMVRNLTGQGGGLAQRTDFTAVTGTFDITDGVLHNSDFSFLGPLLRVVGAGTVNLGSQTQDFRLEPTAVASLTGQGGGIADAGLGVFPILITGTWANPKIRPDLTAAIEGFLSDPNKTIDTVKGLVEGGDLGKAAGGILGTLSGGSGGDGGQGSGGTLGQVLGGALGQGDQSDQGGQTQGGIGGLLGALGGAQRQQPNAEGTGEPQQQTQQGGLGGLLGALGGQQSSAGGETDSQTTETTVGAGSASGQDPIDATGLAPAVAPVPRPAPRTAALTLPNAGGGTLQETTVPQSGAATETPAEALQNLLQPQPAQEQPTSGTGATQETTVETVPQGTATEGTATEGTATESTDPARSSDDGQGQRKRLKPEKLLKKLFN